jgi:hypothetical protein
MSGCVSLPHFFQAMRGAAPSFGITTSITVKTFAAPPSATIFQYIWKFSPSDAVKAISAFQTFAETNIPKEFGVELVIGKSSSAGSLYFSLSGGYYGSKPSLASVIAPFLSKLRKPDTINITPGSYISSVQYLGGLGTLSTSLPDGRDTFYAKSLMTPSISENALHAFTNYAANQAFQAVNFVLSLSNWLSYRHFRTGLSRWTSTAVPTPLLTLSQWTQRPLASAMPSGLSSFMLPHPIVNHRFPAMDINSWMVNVVFSA